MEELPKYHETFIPILTILKDGEVKRTDFLQREVRDKFYGDLSVALLNEKTKSGDNTLLNRIAWGKAYLKQAGMLVQPARGFVQITEKGKSVLAKGSLSLKELLNDAEFLANRKPAKGEKSVETGDSPQDLIDAGFRAIESQTKAELLAKLKTTDPYYFQKVVLLLLEKMGYGDFIETPKSGDGGIDGIINEDKLGLDKIYIQAKRYSDSKVRESEIRNFIGAMSRDAHKGVFVTTSSFDEKAIIKARDAQQKIILIDGLQLVDLLHQYGVGVQVKNSYEVKELDGEFFEEE